MTLLELIVVLALLGLVLAIAAPSFILPSPAPASELSQVLDKARRAAVLRGEPVTLAFDTDGTWRVDGDATPAAPPVVTGTLHAPVGRLRVRISSLGTCVPEPMDGGAAVPSWNAVGCAAASPSEKASP